MPSFSDIPVVLEIPTVYAVAIVGLAFLIGHLIGRLRERHSWYKNIRAHGFKLPGDK